MLLYRLSQYYYRGYHYYRLTGRFYKIKYSYFEKTRTKKIKQEKPEQHFAKLQLKSSYYMLNRLDRDTLFFFVKLVLYHCCAINKTVQKSTGLIFISVLFRE